MQTSLKGLLKGSVDYAGLFEPASLQPSPALDEFRYWRGQDFGFTVGRFCCLAGRLSELLPLLREGDGLSIAAIGKRTTTPDEWDKAREQEAEAMTAFQVAAEGAAEIGAYEVFVPNQELLKDLEGFSSVDVFAELPWREGMTDTVAATSEMDWLALKARTGGTKPGSVPSGSDLASFIWNCMSLEIPFKLTAGLHHPLPNVNAETGDHQHGFVNVFTAAALAYAEEVPAGELVSVLSASDPSEWSFGDAGLSFRGHEVGLDDLEAVREIFAGFGSCSVQEPRDDLEALRWL